MLRLLVRLLAGALLASCGRGGWTESDPLSTNRPSLRPSLGRGRDTKCVYPPPPLRGDLSAQRHSGAPAPEHLKYLALDGTTDLTTSAWTNMGFIHPSVDKTRDYGPGWAGYVTSMYINETMLDAFVAAGYDVFINMEVEITNQARTDGPPWGFTALDAWRAAWVGPNATAGGLWNNSVAKLAAEKKIKGVYFGDELLAGGWSVANLTNIITLVKATWPDGVTYYNEEWEPINNPDWTDSDGEPYGKVPPALDLISYDFYRLNNVSWLQPMCEYHQNLYPKFSTPHQRALLVPGGWGSTSGPRGGAHQFKFNCSACPGTPQCTAQISMSCTSDPFSCTNIPKDKQRDGPGTLNQSGLVWEVEQVLTQMGNRPCWNLSQYDDFNVLNAQAYYDWAVHDPMIVGLNIWTWDSWQYVRGYVGVNVGLKELPRAIEAWKSIGKKIKAGQAEAHAARGTTNVQPVQQ